MKIGERRGPIISHLSTNDNARPAYAKYQSIPQSGHKSYEITRFRIGSTIGSLRYPLAIDANFGPRIMLKRHRLVHWHIDARLPCRRCKERPMGVGAMDMCMRDDKKAANQRPSHARTGQMICKVLQLRPAETSLLIPWTCDAIS